MPQVPDFWGRVLSNLLFPAILLVLGWAARSAWSRWRGRSWGSAAIIARLDAIDSRLDKADRDNEAMREAQHVSMRQQLSHNAEKYLRRAWLTAEERQSWWEMYVAYGTMGQNGYMDAYWQRIEDLPIRSLDEMIGMREEP